MEQGSSEHSHQSIQKLNHHYFLMSPMRSYEQEDFKFLKTEESEVHQKVLSEKLFFSQHSKLFKVELKYKKLFVKKLINEIESEGLEVIQEIYDEFMNLLMSPSENEDFCFKTYFLDFLNLNIVIKQATQMLSSGTTGLISWEACYALCNWVAGNQQIFKNKAVLELGSGTGLLGVLTYKICELSTYIFSDYHEKVLETLQENIRLNGIAYENHEVHIGSKSSLGADETHRNHLEHYSDEITDLAIRGSKNCNIDKKNIAITDCDCCRRSFLSKKCKVLCWKIDWQGEECFDRLDEEEIDVIVGSDLVFDTSIIPSLVDVLAHTLRKSKRRIAYIATTVRNKDTYRLFHQCLSDRQLHWKLVDMKTSVPIFKYDSSSEIEILEIRSVNVATDERR